MLHLRWTQIWIEVVSHFQVIQVIQSNISNNPLKVAIEVRVAQATTSIKKWSTSSTRIRPCPTPFFPVHTPCLGFSSVV
jgi:hypothetical protein